MTRTSGAQIGCQRPSRFWGLGCPKIYHEVEDTLGNEPESGGRCSGSGRHHQKQAGLVPEEHQQQQHARPALYQA
ncbi:hypothetical protein, partial [Thiolapillus sp.]|uniref:hypothetical protein n=1 Tax=Thiolapillus sp. TaxID=2017437 RepID=UPI003AF4A1C0